MVIRVKWLSDRPEMIWPILKLGIKIKTIEQQAIIGLSTYLPTRIFLTKQYEDLALKNENTAQFNYHLKKTNRNLQKKKVAFT